MDELPTRARIALTGLAVCAAASFAACAGPGDGADHDVETRDEVHADDLHADDLHADDLHAGENPQPGSPSAPLVITEDAQRSAGVRVVAAERRELPVPMEVTGFVTPDTTRVMRLRALAEGVIARVDVKLGDRVRAGQPLVEYDNVALGDHIAEYRAAVASRLRAEADLEVRRRSFERAGQLIGLEAIAQQTFELRRSELEQARAGALSAQAEVTRIEERIHRFGLTDEDLSEVAPRDGEGSMQEAAERHREASLNVLRAPFDGVVTEYGVAVGDLVGPDRDLLTITDISTVWVLADVYESDLGRLPPAAEVAIRTEAYPERVFTGRITYVSDTIEAQTRAAHVRCVVENPDDALKLGMFASVTIPTNERIASLAVPVDAVQRIDGEPVVFVQTGADTFERRDVTLGPTAGGVVAVPGGLAPGDPVVAAGSFYLKTALLNDRIGHAH